MAITHLIDMSSATTGNAEFKLPSNVADGLSITAGGSDVMVFDTTTGAVNVTVSGTLTVAGGITIDSQNLGDDETLTFGGVTVMQWCTDDANANKFVIQLPTGGSVDVPVITIGQGAGVVGDMGIHDGQTEPLVCLIAVGAAATGSVIETRKSRGTAAAPTVVTSGDDCGVWRGFGCVAAGEWVQSCEILMETTGTIATTRGPGVITFKTATDAAPSVLTTAMVISAAQNVLISGGGGLTVGSNATDRTAMKGFYMNPSNVAVAVPSITDPDIASVVVNVASAFSMQPAVGDAVIAIPQEALPSNCKFQGAYVTNTDEITLVFGSEGGNVTGDNKNFKFLVIDLT
jgi:hypothetical protein